MSKSSVAEPHVELDQPELQAFGTVVKMPIGLPEDVCRKAVSSLNLLLADTITLRDLYKKHLGRWLDPPSINCICYSTSMPNNRAS